MSEGVAGQRANLIASLAANEMKLSPTLSGLRSTLNSGAESVRGMENRSGTISTMVEAAGVESGSVFIVVRG